MVRIQIAVYDLLAPSRISSAFFYLGVGIYHTAVRVPELGVEFAYGGINSSSSSSAHHGSTGIFSVPSPEDAGAIERLMPGIRFLTRIDVGEAFNKPSQSRHKQMRTDLARGTDHY